MDKFEYLLNNKISDDYESDYKVKMDNKNYQIYLNFDNQLSFLQFQKFLYQNKEEIINQIQNIKSQFLYNSYTHGINHNIRVLIFAYYLAKNLNLNNIDFQIVMDACKYHDVGRINDLYDEKHGLRSANMIEKIVDDGIYADSENLNLLKSIIESHSIPDREMIKIFKKYKLIDENRYKLLACILKDADGLDRVRLSINNKCFCDLNPKYLRFDESKKLVRCAHYLNSVYTHVS